MRIRCVLLLALLALGCRKEEKSLRTEREGPVTTLSVQGAKPNVRLIAPLANGEWRIPAGDYAHTRFSPLAQIDAGNVGNLKMITALQTGVPRGHEGSPLVVGHTMYAVTPFPNNLIAVDLTKPGGQLKFLYEPHPDPRAVGIACCDLVNRGAVYADGKVVGA